MKKSRFWCLILIPLIILICIQICLAEPKTRELFTRIEAIEGVSYRYNPQNSRCYVELSMDKGIPTSEIKILYNAKHIMNFTQKNVIIPLDCDGVIQIKNGSDTDIVVTVKSESASNINVKNSHIPEGMSVLCSVRI